MKKVIWISAILLMMVLLASLQSCSKNPTTPNEPDYPEFNILLDGVQFEPSSGSPGTIITLVGLDSLPVDSGFSLNIGSQPAPLIIADGQPIRTAIPIYIDTTRSSWPITPSGLQTVLLLYNGSPVDSVPKAIRVDSLPSAPEAMDSAVVKLSAGATALKQIALALDVGDTLLLATCDAMDELLYTGDYSLTALLNGTSPVSGYDSSATKIFSSLMVSSGMLDVITRWSDTLITASKLAQRISDGKANTNFLTDEQLASRMQLHDYLAGFGSQVTGQTALEWQTVSAILGSVAIAAPVVGVYEFIVSWVLGELDFIINKIAIAMLPSDVTRLDIDFYNHQISVGDTTEAIVHISAKNNPPNITPADIIGQVLAGLQLTQWIQNRLGPMAARTLTSVIQDIVNWALGVITNILNANYNSPTSLDVALPAVTWDSVWIHNPGLIDLMSPDLSKIGYIDGSFNGRAKDSIGTVGLQMRTQPFGPSMYIGPVMSSLGYVGGAFGDDLTTSNVDTVTIVSELALKVDFANTISPDGANVLGVDAGYYDSHGNSYWAPDVDISLTVTDGAADVTSGVTDAQGHFSSIITIDSIADSVTVHVFAYGEYSSQADTVVVASLEPDTVGSGWGIRCMSVGPGNRSRAEGDVYLSLETLHPIDFDEYYVNIPEQPGCQADVPIGFGGSAAVTSSPVHAQGRVDVSNNVTMPLDSLGNVSGFTASSTCSLDLSWSGFTSGSSIDRHSTVRGDYTSRRVAMVYVDSGYFELTIRGTLSAYGDVDGHSSSECLVAYGQRIIHGTPDTTSFSDTILLGPKGGYLVYILQSGWAEKNRGVEISSYSLGGFANVVCSIRRTPYPQ